MTDIEVIWALKQLTEIGCENNGQRQIIINALDLINRQQAEINKLTYQVNHLKKYDEERDIRLHARLTTNARAEAIKECLEKIEQIDVSESDDWISFKRNRFVDLRKEMIGE